MMYNALKAVTIVLIIFAKNTYAESGPCVQDFFSPGDLIFDVGAHVGVKTQFYLNYGARVICVEPQPICCHILHQKFDANNQVTIVEQALGEMPGRATMWICAQAPNISTFSDQWRFASRFTERNFKWNYTIDVPMTTLDLIIKQFGIPQFCKIDVENFELSVLRGLSQPIPYLSFEFSIETFQNTRKCLEHLQQLGYREFNVGIGEREHLHFESFVSAEELIATLLVLAKTEEAEQLWGLYGDIYAKQSEVTLTQPF